MNCKRILLVVLLIVAIGSVQAAGWKPVTGKKALRAIYENTVVEWKSGHREYCADGSGLLYSWGETLPRTWEIKGKDQVCVSSDEGTVCYTFEQDEAHPSRYRVRNVETEERTIVEISYRKPKTCAK